jgi:hypothetical protein
VKAVPVLVEAVHAMSCQAAVKIGAESDAASGTAEREKVVDRNRRHFEEQM